MNTITSQIGESSGKIAEYLFLKKKDPNRSGDNWIGNMHGNRRISLLVFILCLISPAIKLLF